MNVHVFDFSKPIEGWTQRAAEDALAERTLLGVTLNRFEAGRSVVIGSCKDHEGAFPETLRNRHHRVTWCYRPADGGTEDIVCLVEVPSSQIDAGHRPPSEDPYYRFMVPICVIHDDEREKIVGYAFRSRHGHVIVGSRPHEAPAKAPRKRRPEVPVQPETRA